MGARRRGDKIRTYNFIDSRVVDHRMKKRTSKIKQRAGTTTRYSFGDDAALAGQHAWWARNSQGRTQPVGRLRPNASGFYDIEGNVWESRP